MVSMQCFVFVKQKTAYEMRISDWSSDVCSSDLGFAGGRAEMTDRASVVRSAQRARHHHIARAPGNTRNVDGFFPGWRNTVALQGLASLGAHPVGCPGRREPRFDAQLLYALLQQGLAYAR